jgi:signal transduction histidine kinase
MLLRSSQSLPNLPEVVDPGDFLRALRQALASALGQEVQVSLHGAYNLCSARVSPLELENALRQLALNARDLMPRGGPLEVHIRQHFVAIDVADTALPAGRYLAIGFSAAGLGMTPQMLTRVFDSSPAAEETLSAVVKRLRSVRRFAVLAGGQLKVESRLGYGARVEVILPAA